MKLVEKQIAQTLRKQGLSINEICRKEGFAKGSVSLWVKNIELTEEQRKETEAYIQDLERTGGDPIATEVKPLDSFYEAEAYHKDYYERNSEKPYCRIIINPKIEKVQEKFVALLKTHSP